MVGQRGRSGGKQPRAHPGTMAIDADLRHRGFQRRQQIEGLGQSRWLSARPRHADAG
jgi:hypothetical protein